MDKKYCDICGQPTEKSWVKNSHEYDGERVRIVLTVSLDGKFSGDLCASCLNKELVKFVK